MRPVRGARENVSSPGILGVPTNRISVKSGRMEPLAREAILDKILANARDDLTENVRVRFSPHQVESILQEARRRLLALIVRDGLTSDEEIRAAWRHLVIEFHLKRYWGFADSDLPDEPATAQVDGNEPNAGRAFFRQLVMSMLVIKAGLLYFGSYYSSFPGQGYGWGLAAVCAFSVGSLLYLAWRYRNSDL